MIDPQSHEALNKEISERIKEDQAILDQIRKEIRPYKDKVRRIQPRNSTSVSLVGTDGGNNKIQYDPFIIQLVRVVDSSNNEYCLEAVTPSTKISALSKKQFDENNNPITSLGKLMHSLEVDRLDKLSHMIRDNEDDTPTSPTWIQVYRELVEWAILFDIVKNKEFASDTLVVFDGLLRSKAFAKDLFNKFTKLLEEAVNYQRTAKRRKIYLVGFAKHSKVLTRYRLAMALERVLATNYSSYLEIGRELEENSYIWPEYARGEDRTSEGQEINKFVGGKMFFVKFGNRARDPIWPVDIFLPQRNDAQTVLGHLLSDAMNGFPVPFYPLCLQRAHENAALVDFDFDILQDSILKAIRNMLGDDAPTLDSERIRDIDPASNRY